jgi:hypothetical protein
LSAAGGILARREVGFDRVRHRLRLRTRGARELRNQWRNERRKRWQAKGAADWRDHGTPIFISWLGAAYLILSD